MTATETFYGLAFTTVRVRFAGATDASGARWIASTVRGEDRTRVTLPYDHARASGSDNALPAAQACFAKVRRDRLGEDTDPAEWVAIPGDLSASEYVYTFVPARLLAG